MSQAGEREPGQQDALRQAAERHGHAVGPQLDRPQKPHLDSHAPFWPGREPPGYDPPEAHPRPPHFTEPEPREMDAPDQEDNQ